jgi:hypothetical protein
MATHAQKQLHTKLKAVMKKLHNAYSRVYAQKSFDRRQKTSCISIAKVWHSTTSIHQLTMKRTGISDTSWTLFIEIKNSVA